jgi:DNA modification methylase
MLEIKYLAVVESALNPKAVSKMELQFWQFMYQTGKQYNPNRSMSADPLKLLRLQNTCRTYLVIGN